MVEARRGHAPWAGLALALALAWMPLLWSAWWPHLALVLVPPALIWAWHGARSAPMRPAVPAGADAAALALLWGLAFALLALIVAWPLESLRESGGLWAALGLSLCAGFALLGLWRLGPSFVRAVERPQTLAGLAAAFGREPAEESAAGLAIAVAVFAPLALGLGLLWPGLVAPTWQAGLAAVYPLLAAASIYALHRLGDRAPRLADLPIVEAPTTKATDEAAEPDDDASPDLRLYANARAGRIDAALRALRDGADPHALPAEDDRDQRTLPMLAALHSDLRLLRQLIARGVDLNAGHGGLTPLLAATRDSWHGRPEAVMTLLANGADPRAADHEGNTPLHHAARSTDPAVAALLFDAGAQVDALNHEGGSALAIACAAGNWRLARYLIEHGARPEPADGQPALLAAASGEDDPAGVQLLLRHKARVDARGHGQRTALMQACANGNADIVGVLLDAGADRNAHDAEGHTPLLDAARFAQTEVVARLAQAKPDPRATDGHGANALVLACRAGATPELLRQLVAIGVDPDQADEDGRRAIDVAIENGRWPQVAVLDPSYALPANVAEGLADGHFEKTPRELLRDALAARRFESAQAMLRLGVGPGAEALAALLLEFAGEDDLAPFDWLLRHGASAELSLDAQDSGFFHLLDRGGRMQPALWRLLEHGQAVGGAGGLSRYLAACQRSETITRQYESFALALLERGADAFGAGGPREAPLIHAIRLGWQRVIEALLALGADPNQRDGRGHTQRNMEQTSRQRRNEQLR